MIKMKNLIGFVYVLLVMVACKSGESDVGSDKISEQNLKKHIQYLASADLKGRKANESGYLKAAEYVTKQCKDVGLEPLFLDQDHSASWLQQVPFIDIEYGNDNWLTFSDDKKFYIEENYFLLNKGSAEGMILIDSILYAAYGIHEPEFGWDDFEGVDLDGKYVMIVDGDPDKDEFPDIDHLHSEHHISLSKRIEYLYENGAAGLMIISEASRKIWDLTKVIHQKLGYNPVDPAFWADPYHPELPVLMIHPDIFKAHFPEIITNIDPENYPLPYFFNAEIQLSVDVKTNTFEAPNVSGFIHGTDSILAREYIILSAHLDHIGTEGKEIFYGANDNVSSCAALIEVARELVENPLEHSVIFVFYTAEEPCLWGSQYFVSNLPFDQESILVNLNVEMIGKKEKGKRGTTAIGPGGFLTYFSDTNPLSVNYLDVEDHKRRYSGSDQLSFYKKGIPAIRFGNLDYPEKHTSKDDILIIDFGYLGDVSETLLSIVYEIGNE